MEKSDIFKIKMMIDDDDDDDDDDDGWLSLTKIVCCSKTLFMRSAHIFRELLVNPKERKVVIVESVLSTTKFRNVLGRVFFKHFEVSVVAE